MAEVQGNIQKEREMSAIILLAVCIINAPAGYIVGSLAATHYEGEAGSEMLPIMCAILAPLSAVVALALILKEETK